MLRGLQAFEETSKDSPLKTHPRKRCGRHSAADSARSPRASAESIHKLFDTFASIPFGSAQPYGETKTDISLSIGNLGNRAYPVFKVLFYLCLVFAFSVDANIVQRLKPFLYEGLIKFQAIDLQNRYNIELLDFVGFSSPTVNGKGIPSLSYKLI